jgi:hypothetical protein
MSGKTSGSWLWIIILSVFLVVTVPFVVVLGILYLPGWGALLATVGLIILWGVAAGYKDWVISKRKQAEEESEQAQA